MTPADYQLRLVELARQADSWRRVAQRRERQLRQVHLTYEQEVEGLRRQLAESEAKLASKRSSCIYCDRPALACQFHSNALAEDPYYGAEVAA